MNLKELIALQQGKTIPAGTVEAPEFGEGKTVPLRYLTLAERRLLRDISNDKEMPLTDKYLKLMPLCVCDTDGAPIFHDGDPEILQIPGTLADRIIHRSVELNTHAKGEEKKD